MSESAKLIHEQGSGSLRYLALSTDVGKKLQRFSGFRGKTLR